MNKKAVICLFLAVLFAVVSFLGGVQSVLANTTVTTVVVPCENCGNDVTLTGKVTVTVSPGNQTVKTRGDDVAEQIGINTAEYTVSAACQTEVSSSCSCFTISFADPPSWSFTAEAVFLSPTGVYPEGEEPTPSISLSGSDASRTAKVYSPVAGEWQITFTAEVTCTLQDAEGNDLLDEDDNVQTVTFSGTANCRFKATNSPVLISLEDSVIVRQATQAPTKRKIYEGEVRFADTDSSGVIVLSSEGTGGAVRFGATKNELEIGVGDGNDTLELNIAQGQATKFYVYGKTESASMDDVKIVARDPSNPSDELGDITVTVLWVTLKNSDSDVVSKESSYYNHIVNNHPTKGELGPAMYGWNPAGDSERLVRVGYAFETQGNVFPNDFSYEVPLYRDVEFAVLDFITDEIRSQGNFLSPAGELPVNDQSQDQYRDDKPDKLFDFDVPGLNFPEENVYNVKRNRHHLVNFRAFAAYGDTRCSDVKAFSVVVIWDFDPQRDPQRLDRAGLIDGPIPMPPTQ